MDPLLQAEFGQQPLCEAANIGLIGLHGLLQMRKCLFFLNPNRPEPLRDRVVPGVCWIEADGFAVFASSFFHILFTLENVAPNVVCFRRIRLDVHCGIRVLQRGVIRTLSVKDGRVCNSGRDVVRLNANCVFKLPRSFVEFTFYGEQSREICRASPKLGSIRTASRNCTSASTGIPVRASRMPAML